MYTEFEMREVKVPFGFLGTVGFSPPRDGRYFCKNIATIVPLTLLPYSNAFHKLFLMTPRHLGWNHVHKRTPIKLKELSFKHVF